MRRTFVPNTWLAALADSPSTEMDVIWDQSRFDAAIRQRVALTTIGRTAAEVVNTAAYWIAVNAKALTPFSSLAKIDTDLNVAVNLVSTQGSKKKMGPFAYGGAGKKFRRGGKFQRENRSFGKLGNLARIIDGAPKNAQVPLLALIIQARANPGSNYNALTGGRWALTASPFKGVGRAEGAQAMLGMMRRILAARHSSIKYLLSGWIPAIMELKPFAVQKYRRGGASPGADSGAYFASDRTRGFAIPASEGFTVTAKIANATGTLGANSKAQNEALWRYGEPALQQAIDIETELMESYVEAAMKKDNAVFNMSCA